jgi:hypothetical protein
MHAQTTITNAVSNTAAVQSAIASPKAVRAQREVVSLHRVNLRSLIEKQGSSMFSVDYEKQNGMARTLTGRLGVKSYLKGGKNKVVADERSYITVFEVQIKEYRTVDLATVTELRAGGKIYRVID